MPGERFSRLYAQPGELAQDSSRARHRIGALFGEAIFKDRCDQIAAYLGREMGLLVPREGTHLSDWHAFVKECRTADFLDTITLVYRYLYWHVGEEIANWWRDVVKQIFVEENLAYEIDNIAGIHPAVDREFQGNLATAVAALQADRYRNVRELAESVPKYLSASPPKYKQGWRAVVAAMEALFALMFPHVPMSPDEIERRLRPVVLRAYEGQETAQRAALKMLAGLGEWVEASEHYRHRRGADESAQPPADVAILGISHGASLLRWLAGLDEDRCRHEPSSSG